MGNKSSIWELCMVFGVVAIVLAGFMSTASASDDQKSATSWSRSEGSHTKIDSLLVQKMEERPGSELPVIIELKEQQKEPFKVQEAKSLTISSQKSLTASLESIQAGGVQEYWIVNAVSATVPVQHIHEIAARPDVKKVWLNEQIKRIETASAISGQGQDVNMVANLLPDDSGYSPDRVINYTPASPVDEVDASGYTTTRLYLRPDLIGPPYEDYLSEDPETSGWYAIESISDDGDYLTWGNYTLKEDINGTLYSYGIYFASESSTTFEIEIIVDGTTVATFTPLTVPYDECYLPFSEEITGMDPTTSEGDEVVLKVTKTSGGRGFVCFGTGLYSYITMPSIDIADYGDDIINAPLMWSHGYDGINVNISILDTGIDDMHPDLIGKVIAEEDFTDDGTPDDQEGHGTHCAGIAAGKYNTSTNVTGVAPGATLINAKVLNKTGYGNTSGILSGIQMSIDHNADIMSMSLGGWQGDGTGRDLESMAVTNAVNAGCVVVIAAGNSGPGESTIGSPSVACGAIVVAASDSNDAIVNFSSRGPTGDGRVGIDIAAPGYKIIAPNAFWEDNVDYFLKSGTSMSCPHVAGAAALLLQANSSLTPEEVERALKNGADVIEGDKADQSRVVYYAFNIDDIDNITIRWQLINNSENWLVAGMPPGSVLVIDDENPLYSGDNQSADIFQSVFEDIGYTVTVEESDMTSYSTWGNYDIVVWSCGNDTTPINPPEYKEMLVDYVTDGGHLLLESGSIAYWIDRFGSRVIDRELREKVLHATDDWAYSDVGNLTISNSQHPIATTPNVLPETIKFTPTNREEDSGDADAVRILHDAVGIYNWSYVKRGGDPILDSVARISYGLIAYNDTDSIGCGYDVWEQGAGRLDVNDAHDALINGILVDPQWFVGIVRSGSYTKTFTVVNNDTNKKTVNITGSTDDAGNWITLPTTVTVPAKGTADFDAIMNVPGDAVGTYKGSIRVNDGIEDIIIPVSVNAIWDTTKTGPITGNVDEANGGYCYWDYFPRGDWVYYTLEVPHTANLNLSLNWTNTSNNLVLWLFNSSGDYVGLSAEKSISVNSPEAGNWTVAINAWILETAQETYTLEITTTLPLRGDVNHDGVVTPADAVIVLEMAVRGEYNADADVDCDNMVTSLDALMVLQVAAGAITV
ncbi:MAG: S8 family serine peptidase [Euryarchaeota archaeon]|nr:S8 family serine peptidase [Euryarchaeota archaeon]